MKQFTFLLLLFSFSITQAKTITGTVTTEWEESLAGANIIIKGTDIGVSTNAHGIFEIDADANDVLLVSYVGRETKEITILRQQFITIELELETLDEVLLIGYGGTLCRKFLHYCCKTTYCKGGKSKGVQDVTAFNRTNNKKSRLYPNPSQNGFFNIKMVDAYTISEIKVVSMAGQVVLSQQHHQITDSDIVVDMSSFSSGVYLIELISNGTLLETKRALRL